MQTIDTLFINAHVLTMDDKMNSIHTRRGRCEW